MPLIRNERPHTSLCWGLWQIDESVEALIKDMVLDEELDQLMGKVKNVNKVLESVAVRKLLEEIAGIMEVNYDGIWKDDHGKPHLINSMSHISVSHSYPFVAASINTTAPTGIDLEHFTEKVNRIEHKFLNEKEIFDADHDTNKLIIYWSAKESLYKMYGRRQLIFKENIEISPFEFQSEGTLSGRLINNRLIEEYELQYHVFDSYVVTYTL